MDTPQWSHQGAGLASAMEELGSATTLPGTNVTAGARAGQVAAAERKPRPHREQAVNCPRCNSDNTKFCYYNNYSLTQPRYFCKACRRYWTQGGSLRNVPVGGGSRKNKKSSHSSAAAPSKSSPAVDLIPPPPSSRGFGVFMPIPSLDSEYPTGLGALVQEFSQPTLSFPLDVGGGGGCSSGYGSFGAGVDQLICGGGGGKLLLPFVDAEPAAVPNSISIVGEQFEQNKRQVIGGDPPPVFWNGNYIIGGGSWLS